jgi:hypothetical protein
VSERAEGRETIVTLAAGLLVGFALGAVAISRFLALGKSDVKERAPAQRTVGTRKTF